MSTDLMVNLQEKALQAVKSFGEIGSFKDLEMWLMKGQGLSNNSYKTYMQAVKLFYEHVGGLHPLQWTPAHIEDFYDAQREKNGIGTAYNRIAGLKNLCKSIKAQLPFWESPFDIMSEKTKSKINTTAKGQKKKALYVNEVRGVFEYLAADTSLKGLQNHAIILTLFTTGLRAQELCDLTYDSIEHDTDTGAWYLSGIGKGSKPYQVEVWPQAIEKIKEAFRAQFGRDLRPGEPLFYNLRGTRMQKPAMWTRMKSVEKVLKNGGVIRHDIEFSAHLFRRSYLTLLNKAGMGITALQEHSRHSNIQTLTGHYIDNKESTRPYLDSILGAVS